MEKGIFIRPEVSGELQKTVEARLHTDRDYSPHYERMKELQAQMTGVTTLPVYIVIDPRTGKQIARMDGARREAFLGFLRRAVAERE